MHPSLTADFNPSQFLLEPQKKMGANDLCWCQSGIKWKKCHRDREHQQPVPIGKLMAEQRNEMSNGYCLHPQAIIDTCSPKIIRAHTVQRKGGLAAITENGHVISPKTGFEDILVMGLIDLSYLKAVSIDKQSNYRIVKHFRL